jgi:hypothetical protein
MSNDIKGVTPLGEVHKPSTGLAATESDPLNKNYVLLLECSYLYTCSSFLAFPSLNTAFAQ